MHAVLTAADLDPLPRIPVRLGPFDEPLDPYLQPVLAADAVAHLGIEIDRLPIRPDDLLAALQRAGAQERSPAG